MKKLNSIISTRKALSQSFWHLVWEWEDIIAEKLNIPLVADKKIWYLIKKSRFFQPFDRGYNFVFDMNPWHRLRTHGIFKVSSKTIPYIIDFYLNDDQVDLFVQMYKDAPVVFISSREVYEWLKKKNTGLTLAHLPISLSDKYALSQQKKFDKKYDIILLGRLSPTMKEYLDCYLRTNPKVSILNKKIENGRFNYYDEKGNYVGNTDSREDYLKMMRMCRIILYTTPGYDGEKITNGFSQVTPRVLEAMACGCHLIMKYPDNPDTRFFQLSDICESVENYKQFEAQMNKYLSSAPDLNKYCEYLYKHYTSKRIPILQSTLQSIL